MGNTDDDAELTTDWHPSQPPPARPAVPHRPGPQGPPPPRPAPLSAPPAQVGPPPSAPYAPPPPSAPMSPEWESQAATPGSWQPAGLAVPAPPPPPRGGGSRLVVVGVIIVVVIALAGAAYYVLQGRDTTETAGSADDSASSGPPSESASSPAGGADTRTTAPSGSVTAPTVSEGNLASLLSSPTEAARVVDDADLTPGPVVDAPLTGASVSPSNCTSAIAPGTDTVYGGSNFTGFAAQNLVDASRDHKVVQVIASYDGPAEAKAFYDTQVAAWRQCNFTTVNSSAGSDSVEAKTAATGENDGLATLLVLPSDGRGQCQRAITVRLNTVVDVRVCAPSVGSGGYTLARDIGQRITGSR